MSDRITEEWQAFQRPEDEGSNYWRIRMRDGLKDSLHGYCGEKRARLAAAAPDLLEALKVMLFAFEELAKVIKPLSSDPVIVSARAAVCKAEGITHHEHRSHRTRPPRRRLC